MSTPKASGTLLRQTLVTAAVLALYYFAERLGAPGIDRRAFAEARLPIAVHWMSLGLTPWISGFLLVELASLLPGPFRRLRRGGWEGRARLDRASLIASLACGCVQGAGITMFLERTASPAWGPLIAQPGWGFRLLFTLTLLAGSTALFWLGSVVSRWGLGNGYSLLLLTPLLVSIFREAAAAGSADPGAPPPLLQVAGAIALAALFLVHLLRADRSAPAGPEPRRRSPVALPQSLLPVLLAGLVLRLLFGSEGGGAGLLSAALGSVGLWPWIGGQVFLIAFWSWLLFRLFSGPGRLRADLPEALAGSDEARSRRSAELRGRARYGLLLLALGSAGLGVWSHYLPGPYSMLLDVVRLGILLGVALDVASQWRFTRREGRTAPLCRLNNVHLAPLLVEHLAAAGIPATLQGFRHRALFFSYLPLVRIGVLVPEARLEEARGRLAELDLRVV